jgi:hypothetical protein
MEKIEIEIPKNMKNHIIGSIDYNDLYQSLGYETLQDFILDSIRKRIEELDLITLRKFETEQY